MFDPPPAAEERHFGSPVRRSKSALESGLYTAVYTAALCGACALLATLPRLLWKDRIAANKELERTRAVVEAPGLEPLDLGLGPDAVTRATPMYPPDLRKPPHMRRKVKRPPFMVPPGTRNLALGRPVTSSTVDEPIIGELFQVTDGVKRSGEPDFVELDAGLQWVQIDLGMTARIYAIVVWHYYRDPVIYNDVIVQASDDPGFDSRAVTLFSNDHDDSSGLGKGTDTAYFARWWGEIVDARGKDRRGTPARYVRVYTGGGAAEEDTRFVEVAVYGLAESSPQPLAP